MNAAAVELIGVTKTYAGKTVLDDLHLTIATGELIALLGPSGCGKTTSLRLIAGFEQPDVGQVTISGRDATRLRTNRRGIGIVFQAYSLFPHLSAAENVAYGLRVRRASRSRRETRAGELLDMVGLAEHRDKFPAQLSGGQQQRVALARALAVEPSVLLLDEPLSALDAKVRVQLREEIRRIQAETGTTTVMVTHDQEEALTMADRIAVMRSGRIEQIGSPDDVYRRPETPFVSSFVGNVNRIPATRREDGMVRVLGADIPGVGDAGGRPEVVALVRPDDIALRAAEDGAATIVSMVLRGPITSVNVEAAGLDSPLRVDLASRDALAFHVGDSVGIHVDLTRVVVEGRDGDA